MDPRSTLTTPSTVLSEVLADLAFMLTHDRPAKPETAARWCEATISYRGPLSGTLHVRCTPNFALLVAANLLGLEPQDPAAAAKAEDALKELMNVFCGQFVTSAYGTEHVFDLSIPQVRELKAPKSGSPDATGFTALYVEGHTVLIAHQPASGS